VEESEFAGGRYDTELHRWRRAVLRDTIAEFERRGEQLRTLAQDNLARWAAEAQAAPAGGSAVAIEHGDWGEVAGRYTRRFGRMFAVLNMANAYLPGGRYIEGTAAQEENMFRRTDCHLAVDDAQLQDGRYTESMTQLLNGEHGRVYLDNERPRVCMRGPEVTGELRGYELLGREQVFPFVELRAAARNCRRVGYDEADARRRIAAQLETLLAHEQRCVVLGASGCGAFANPPEAIARLYREELAARGGQFECVAFAIYDAGYGPANGPIFEREFAQG